MSKKTKPQVKIVERKVTKTERVKIRDCTECPHCTRELFTIDGTAWEGDVCAAILKKTGHLHVIRERGVNVPIPKTCPLPNAKPSDPEYVRT